MSISGVSSGLKLTKKIIFSLISLAKILLALEGEIGKFVSFLDPFFLKVVEFLSKYSNIVLFVGFMTLMTGAFIYFIFPVGEVCCFLATAIGYILADEITAGFVRIVGENGLTAWQAGAKCAPWVFWITLPTLFVGAICVCKRVTKWGGLVKTLLIGGLITLIVGVLLGVLALVAYGTGFLANPARTCMLVAMALVTVAEQVAIFRKDIS